VSTTYTQLNVAKVGPGLGPGQTVVVEGDPITKPIPYTNIALAGIDNTDQATNSVWPFVQLYDF
jgi:hypothetical protein